MPHALVVDIPHEPLSLKGAWQDLSRKGDLSDVEVSCPGCGRRMPIPYRWINQDGVINVPVYCPTNHSSCKWWGYIRLKDLRHPAAVDPELLDPEAPTGGLHLRDKP